MRKLMLAAVLTAAGCGSAVHFEQIEEFGRAVDLNVDGKLGRAPQSVNVTWVPFARTLVTASPEGEHKKMDFYIHPGGTESNWAALFKVPWYRMMGYEHKVLIDPVARVVTEEYLDNTVPQKAIETRLGDRIYLNRITELTPLAPAAPEK